MDMLGIDDAGHDFHFQSPLDDAALQRFESGLRGNFNPLVRANVESVKYIAGDRPDLIAVGMAIGPFSLLTKLLADPITPVFFAGSGSTATDEPEVALLEQLLEISTRLVLRTLEMQIAAGAKMMVIAEPAANKVYFSPAQLEAGSDVFQRYAMAPNRRIAKLLADAKVQMLFHCCGELVEPMLRAFGASASGDFKPGQLAQTVGRRRVRAGHHHSFRQPAQQAVLFRQADQRGRCFPPVARIAGPHARSSASLYPGQRMRRAARAGMRTRHPR